MRLLLASGLCVTLTHCGGADFSGKADVLMYHNDGFRSGIQSNERVLTPKLLQSARFGKVAGLQVSGDVYAQPLVVSRVMTSNGHLHTAVITVTSQDQVSVFDINTYKLLWQKSLLQAGEELLVAADVGSPDMKTIGITGTPVVDPQSNITSS